MVFIAAGMDGRWYRNRGAKAPVVAQVAKELGADRCRGFPNHFFLQRWQGAWEIAEEGLDALTLSQREFFNRHLE